MIPSWARPIRSLTIFAWTPLSSASVACVPDIVHARAAGTAVIAYANKPGKRSILTAHDPDAVIGDLDQLTHVVDLPYVF